MGRLARHTVNQYRWMLKRLRRVLPLMPEDDPERARVIAKIKRLTEQLGLEMTDLEASLARGPGRPRKEPDISGYEGLLDKLAKNLAAETPEAREKRIQEKHAELKAKLEREDPEFIRRKEAERQSKEELDKIIKLGGDNEGPGKATDEVGPTGGGNPET